MVKIRQLLPIDIGLVKVSYVHSNFPSLLLFFAIGCLLLLARTARLG
jgi:uncharacterized membrane protein YesL